MPRATRSSLTVTNSCGSSASRPTAITPDGSEPRMSLAKPLSASMDSRSPVQPTNVTPGAISSRLGGELARLRAAAGGGAGLEAALRLAQLVLERGDPLLERLRARAPTAAAARSRSANRSSISRSAPAPVTASMRRMPEPMLRSPVITKLPIWPDARQCVPPHSSWLKPSTRIVRTRSPYFSSKNASAPAPWASAIVIHSTLHRAVLADDPPDLALDRELLVVGEAAVEREVEAQVVRVHERARLARPLPHHVAQRAVEQVRARVVAHRVGAALGVHLGPQRRRRRRTAPCRTPRWTVRPAVCVPATRWTSSTLEQDGPVRRSRRTPMSATWPPLSA